MDGVIILTNQKTKENNLCYGELLETIGYSSQRLTLVNVIDISEDGQPEWETDYETCMMCGNKNTK